MARHPMTLSSDLSARAGVYRGGADRNCASRLRRLRQSRRIRPVAARLQEGGGGAGDFARARSPMRSTGSPTIPRPSPRTAGRACSRRASCNSPAAWCRPIASRSAARCSRNMPIDLRRDRAAIRRAGPGARRLLGTGDRFRQGDGQHGDDALARHVELRLPPSRGIPRAADLCAESDRARRSLSATRCAGPRMARSASSSSSRRTITNMPSISTVTAGAT